MFVTEVSVQMRYSSPALEASSVCIYLSLNIFIITGEA